MSNKDTVFLQTESANLATALNTQNRQLALYENAIEQNYVYMYIFLSVDAFLLISLFVLSLQSRGFFSLDSALKLIFFFFLLAMVFVLYFIQMLRSRKNTDFKEINLQDPPILPNNTPNNQASLKKSGRLLAATSQSPPCIDDACCPAPPAGSSGSSSGPIINPYWSSTLGKCVLPQST